MEDLSNINSRYAKVRIIEARALQIAMGAPIHIKISKEELEEIKYSPIKISELEYLNNKNPIKIKDVQR